MPTATIISVLVIVGALVVLAVRHRPGAADGDRWGDPPDPAAGAEAGLPADAPADVAAEPEPARVTAGAQQDETDDGAIRPGDGA